MGKASKKRIKNIKMQYTGSETYENDTFFQNIFAKKLSIVIPGDPITDSRPRRSGNFFYNPKKIELCSIFDELYKDDDLLKNTCIPYPIAIVTRIYHNPKKKFEKHFKKDEELKEKYDNEEIISIKRKDNDNYEKVHWDVLQDEEYRVILDDHHVCKNVTEKFYSDDPRIEIDILFNENYMYDIFKKDVESTVRYNKQQLSEKYWNSHDLTDEELVEHFKTHIKEWNFYIPANKSRSKREKKKIKMSEKLYEFIEDNFTTDIIKTLIKIINPDMLTRDIKESTQDFCRYIVDMEGKI